MAGACHSFAENEQIITFIRKKTKKPQNVGINSAVKIYLSRTEALCGTMQVDLCCLAKNQESRGPEIHGKKIPGFFLVYQKLSL